MKQVLIATALVAFSAVALPAMANGHTHERPAKSELSFESRKELTLKMLKKAQERTAIAQDCVEAATSAQALEACKPKRSQRVDKDGPRHLKERGVEGLKHPDKHKAEHKEAAQRSAS